MLNIIGEKISKDLEKKLKKVYKIFLREEKAKIINEILTMYRCDATTVANLKDVGGSANAGSMKIKKNTLTSRNLVLVHQSVTGLFETEEELS